MRRLQRARLQFRPLARRTCTVKLAEPTISAKAASSAHRFKNGAGIVASVAVFLNVNDNAPVARYIEVCLRLNIVQSQTCSETGLSPRLRSERPSRKSQSLDGRIRNATGKESDPLQGKRFTWLLKTAKPEWQRPPARACSSTVRSMNDISLFLRQSFFAFPRAGFCPGVRRN